MNQNYIGAGDETMQRDEIATEREKPTMLQPYAGAAQGVVVTGGPGGVVDEGRDKLDELEQLALEALDDI